MPRGVYDRTKAKSAKKTLAKKSVKKAKTAKKRSK